MPHEKFSIVYSQIRACWQQSMERTADNQCRGNATRTQLQLMTPSFDPDSVDHQPTHQRTNDPPSSLLCVALFFTQPAPFGSLNSAVSPLRCALADGVPLL